MKRYLKGLFALFGILFLGFFGLILLRLLQFTIGAIYILVAFFFAIAAFIILPEYIGKKKTVESKSYSLKNIKKS